MPSETTIIPDDYLIIQEKYKKQKLKEMITGPIVSTFVHILLIISVSFIKGETHASNPQIEEILE